MNRAKTFTFSVLPTAPHAFAPAARPAAVWGPEVRRILCVRLDNLGDVLMTTPAMRALREAGPGRQLTLLASSAGAQMAPYLPDVDEVIRYNAPWVSGQAEPSAQTDLQMRRALEAGRFDAAVIFTVYSQNPLPAALMCYLAGIPRRLAWCRENPYHLLTDWAQEKEPQHHVRHEVERQLALVEHVGATAATTATTGDMRMRFAVADEDRHALDALLATHGVRAGTPCVVLHAGASSASRRYPPERFGEVASHIAAQLRCPVLLTGGVEERETVQRVASATRASVRRYLCDLSGLLTLGQLAALLERAAVLVSNNTGPVHIAAALGTPVVDLYALTNPQHTPWQTPSRVLFHDVACRWCYRSVCPEGHHACLLGVPAAEVAEAALQLAAPRLSPPSPPSPPSLASAARPAPRDTTGPLPVKATRWPGEAAVLARFPKTS